VQAVTPTALRLGVELHLETSLPPERFRELLARLDPQAVKVNYDIGNSAALGYDPDAEFAAYGERIGSVHVKDRMLHGSTVPLGHGHADFSACFSALRRIGYQGDFILQVARDKTGQEVSWARDNRQFVLRHWRQARQAATVLR
jgi:hexulose-6-phosphate isomerase